MQIPEHALDEPDDLAVVDDDGIHLGIAGLQPDVAVFLVERLDRRFALHAVDHRDDDVSVAGGVLLLHEDVVAVEDARFDHGLSVDRQHEIRALADEAAGHGETVFDILLRQDLRSGI